MPTQLEPNRTQFIRSRLAPHPSARPMQIVATMKAKGIAISTSLAESVKYANPK